MKLSKVSLFVLVACLISCRSNEIVFKATDFEQIQFVQVGFKQLLNNVQRYDQQNIEIIGFAVFAFETTAIYLDKESSIKLNYENGMWIVPDSTISEAQRRSIEENCNRKRVKIKGIFQSNEHGHLGLYKGGIIVKYIEVL